ncbi:hypothetical protein [Ruicaihuangia caeni]|uniref:hypothetical protein n=1 Tax=Ruicaihuangia caeni TaxID=3042517 RepID=UPI00338F2802
MSVVAVGTGAWATEVVARYPGEAAQVGPDTAGVHVQLETGWFQAHEDFDIVLTGSNRDAVEGRTEANGSGALSFTPDEPLAAGKYAVKVEENASGASEGNVIDSWSFTVEAPSSLAANSSGGASAHSGSSILLVARDGTRDSYLAEVLRAEGFTSFDTATPEQVSSDLLADRAVVILGAMSSTGPHISDIRAWVLSGGDLVTMKPQGELAELAGLQPTGETLENAYLQIDTDAQPGAGLTAEAMQFKGDALLYSSGSVTETVATLLPDPANSGQYPALTVSDVGDAGGRIAAFSYDLATSVMYTRQGDPAAAGSERDGSPPIRPNDLFMGSNGEPDPLDLSRIGTPQADEQMRLLSNVLEELHGSTSPLPRFWYLPHGENAAIVMTADDHATKDGSRTFLERMVSAAPKDCDVAQWECARASVWLDPSTPLSPEDAKHYSDLGFDLGVHVSTQCADWTPESLADAFTRHMLAFRARYPDLPDQKGHRLHCIAYSDWLGLPKEDQKWGIRIDMDYYNWPPSWIDGHPGYMTGSALPMRFSDETGRMLNVFQQESHLVNETWNGSTAAIEELIDAAEDERGYYGAFGTHFDFSDNFDQQLMDIATRRGVPMISARQLLDFTDGRQASMFENVRASADGGLAFDIDVDPLAQRLLWGMLPVDSGDATLASLTADGNPVDYDVRLIKGVRYALFEAGDAHYEARYR